MKKFILFLFLILLGDLAWRMRPAMRDNECYNAFFPKEKFLAKVKEPVPDWISSQIDADFKDGFLITEDKVEKTYQSILKKIPLPIYCYHYRIINNELYKYIPSGGKCSPRDTYFEKAFKTLLSHIEVPNLDFVLIPMDGIPEAFMPPDFYLPDDKQPLVPILGQAKLKEPLTRSIVLIPDQLSLSESWYNTSLEILSINNIVPWSEKIGKAIWRGGVSDGGLYEGEIEELPPSPRLNLCRLTKSCPKEVDALFYACDYPIAKALIEKENLLTSFISKLDQLHYKYLPALDGRMCTYPGFHWRLLSTSLTLKQESDQIQWFYSALKPYAHYIPIATDMSDVVEKVKWANLHDLECKEMSKRAREFVLNDLMYEDCYRYLYLVCQRYATHQQIDFSKLLKKTKKDPHWVNIQYRRREGVYKMIHKTTAKAKNLIFQPKCETL